MKRKLLLIVCGFTMGVSASVSGSTKMTYADAIQKHRAEYNKYQSISPTKSRQDWSNYVSSPTSSAQEFEQKYYTGTSTIVGLEPGKNYLVGVYGVTAKKGGGYYTMDPIKVTSFTNTVLAQTSSDRIEWHDGQAPHNAVLMITAPADGKIKGFTDKGAALNMFALSMNATVIAPPSGGGGGGGVTPPPDECPYKNAQGFWVYCE